MTYDQLSKAFEARVGVPPTGFARAPGRVNLIGEHTDYAEGFVLPLAIDKEVRVAFAPRPDGVLAASALDVDDDDTFDVASPHRRNGWQGYVHGVAWSLAQQGSEVPGANLVFSGDVPRGSGLSSSAALELAIARSLVACGNGVWDPRAMALACQRAENDWLGVASGIMDQMIGACGVEGSASLIDCRDLRITAVPLPASARVVVLDTGTRRGLVDGAYNERRRQVEAAAAALGVVTLRDADEATLARHAATLDVTTAKRARHVVTENARVLRAVDAMHGDDPVALGALMNASHDSLRDDFEVSSFALDAMVEAARAVDGCYGARLTGAGFAGCCVALVDDAVLATFTRDVGAAYHHATGHEPAIYPVRATAGASLVS